MALGGNLLVVLILVVAIWIFVEIKRFKHKIFAVFLIVLIIFSYVSFSITLKGKDIDFTSLDGIQTAGKLYFSWLGSIFGNLKEITANAIHMDWRVNETLVEKKTG